MKWRNLLMPKEIVRDDEVVVPTTGRFIIEPLERGLDAHVDTERNRRPLGIGRTRGQENDNGKKGKQVQTR